MVDVEEKEALPALLFSPETEEWSHAIAELLPATVADTVAATPVRQSLPQRTEKGEREEKEALPALLFSPETEEWSHAIAELLPATVADTVAATPVRQSLPQRTEKGEREVAGACR
nr:hypothetical protein Itr_chr04CG20210 [Ipomoea trifida]